MKILKLLTPLPKKSTKFLEKARKAADISDSTELFLQAEQMLIDDAGFVPIYYENVYFFRQKDAEDVFYNPFTGIVDFSQGKRK